MKKILIFTLAFAFVLGNGFMMFEGVMASAETATSSSGGPVSLDNTVSVTVTSELALVCDTGTDVNLGSINGMTGGSGTGATICNVSTVNDAGYTLKLQAGDDGLYDSVGLNTIDPISDGAFSVAASASGVGYNVASSSVSDTNWKGLSTVQDTIASNSSATSYGGVTTTINYRVEVGAAKNQPAGTYDTLVTYTATDN